MLFQKLIDKKLIHPPDFLKQNINYVTLGGSHAYGTNTETSDFDIWGFAIPRREMLFPHLYGYIPGFGTAPPKFDQYQESHIIDPDNKREYDLNIFNIVKAFELARQGNPNVIDMFFVPHTCVVFTSQIGELVRENRTEFLSKLCYPRYKGYLFSQLKHIQNKDKMPTGKRKEIVDRWGWDLKYGMHLCRLADYIRQILTKGDLDLQENREQLKAIRRGEWTEKDLHEWFSAKEKELDTLYSTSKLRDKPDEKKLKNILLQCFEIHYGNLEKAFSLPPQDQALEALRDIDSILEKNKNILART